MSVCILMAVRFHLDLALEGGLTPVNKLRNRSVVKLKRVTDERMRVVV